MKDDKKEKELPKSIEANYTKDRDYRRVYVNGVYGGMTPKGELLFDLFHEYGNYPEIVTYEIKDGRLGAEISKLPKQTSLVRERKIGVIVPLDSAENIARWILEKVEEIRRITKEAESEGGD